MTLGCTLPLSLLTEAVLPPDLTALAPQNNRAALLTELAGCGVGSVELHAVDRHTSSATLLQAAELCAKNGMTLTLHGTLTNDITPSAFFAPYLPLLTQPTQPLYLITLHGLTSLTDTKEALYKLADYAIEQALPIRLMLENDHKDPLQNAADHCGGVREIVEPTDKIGICWDMGHYYHNVLCGYETGPLPSTAFLSRVQHTHIHAVENGEMHLPFSLGHLPLFDYLTALKAARFDGILNLELSPARFYRRCDPFTAYLTAIDTLKRAAEHVF